MSNFLKLDWHTVQRGVRNLIFMIVFVAIVPGMRPNLSDDNTLALGIARDHLFDFAEWQVSSVWDKHLNATIAPQQYMREEDRVQYVTDYLQLVNDIAVLESEVKAIYVDPTIDDPEAASADIRAERDTLREEQHSKQALAEAIIQAQASELLVEYGFGTGGQLIPPVAIRFTELPALLIVSSREEIRRTGSYPVEHGMTVDRQEALETEVDAELGVSSLIVPLGGLAVYPAMLIETGYTPHVYDISAHEWAHHYLSFYPLGFNYGQSPELFTINETVASIVGAEIGWAVMDRYYPDFAGPPPDFAPQPPPEPPDPNIEVEPPAFDFRAEMRITRVRVDEMLGYGSIEEAERYMERRRKFFVKNGYRIRKLNQAYFAFYGAYADEPGATGSDPVGPALRELRYYSDSLYEYLTLVRGMTTFAEVEAALEEARLNANAGQ